MRKTKKRIHAIECPRTVSFFGMMAPVTMNPAINSTGIYFSGFVA